MSARVLFVLGAGRSGSTVFEKLLAARGGVVAAGELRFVWQRGMVEGQLCSCGAPFGACPFWSAVLAGVEQSVGDRTRLTELVGTLAAAVDRNRFIPAMHIPWLRRPEFDRAHAEVTVLLERLYTALDRASGSRLVVDSSKDPSYAHLLSTVPGIDVAFVNLVRDSRAVAHSWRRPKPRPEIHWQDASMDVWPYRRSAVDWDTKYLLSAWLKRVCPERVVTLRYENVVVDPGAALAAVDGHLADLGMGDAGSAARLEAESIYHTVSGNPIRFDSSAPVLRMDDEWRRAMPRWHRATVAALTAPFLVHHLRAVRRGLPSCP